MHRPLAQAGVSLIAAILIGVAAPAGAQSADPPQPIATPPIPAAPQLSPAPPVTFGPEKPPARPSFDIPARPALSAIVIPPEAPITPADRSDPIPPPQSGVLTGPPARVSPGGSTSQIDELAFIVDPEVSALTPNAESKLRAVARSMEQNPAARLEVRCYAPARPENASNAHRLSLARFLAVRAFLTQSGVDDNRIDGRALISDSSELNADRIELYIER